jgi:acetyl esterase/lipase
VAKRLRDGEGPLPASLVLVYPLLHAQLPAASDDRRAARGATVFSPDVVVDLSANFVGDPRLFEDTYAFPANGDVSRQPPVYILNSETDTLRASGEAYGTRLAQAGVPVRVEYEPGTVHGHLNHPTDPGAERSIKRMAAWLLA